MSKRSQRSGERSTVDLNRAPTNQEKGSKPTTSRMPSQAAFRELIESVVIAFILAFLFRTFEAEAFVIPTGSMATTLMGRHKDVTCPMCGYPYQVGASEEVDQTTGALLLNKKVIGGTCPMCRYTDDRMDREPSFNGDRILVGKFAYEFEDPQRWDVAVFRFPAEAKTNYIKRIVGLPEETIRIRHGDLFVKKAGETEFTIARKPPEKLRAMLQTVYDDDYVLPEKLASKGWPARWQAEVTSDNPEAEDVWRYMAVHKKYLISGERSEGMWLRYRHFVPDERVWDAIGRDSYPREYRPEPQLISDYCAYNTTLERTNASHDAPGLGLHWVGDLALSCTLDVRSTSGRVVFELVEGGRQMQCGVDVATGEAKLSISGEKTTWVGKTGIRRPGACRILFANVDDQLRFWVEGRLVQFDSQTTYGPLDNNKPTQADLAPVGIASFGAHIAVSHLKVLRDIYYIADRETTRAGEPISDFNDPIGSIARSRQGSIADFLSRPEAYDSAHMQTEEFKLEKDQFLVLGDNSARSKDSRLWGPEFYVDRDLLIGKALFIYWPHSWDEVTVGNVAVPFPFFPNFRRMHLVR